MVFEGVEDGHGQGGDQRPDRADAFAAEWVEGVGRVGERDRVEPPAVRAPGVIQGVTSRFRSQVSRLTGGAVDAFALLVGQPAERVQGLGLQAEPVVFEGLDRPRRPRRGSARCRRR